MKLITKGYSEHEVMDMPIDKFFKMYDMAVRDDAMIEAKELSRLANAISNVFSKKGIEELKKTLKELTDQAYGKG